MLFWLGGAEWLGLGCGDRWEHRNRFLQVFSSIRKMKLIPNQESEYGKFNLVPEEGQKLRHFIDFESKLLVVNANQGLN